MEEVQDYKPDLVCPVESVEDEADFRNIIRYSIANGSGANIVFALGTTGEFYAIPFNDKRSFIDIAVDEIAQNKDVVMVDTLSGIPTGKSLELAIGVTGENLDETVELAQYAEEKEADYIVLLPGYITRKDDGSFTRRGITDNVQTVLDETNNVRVMIYNNPEITGDKNVRTETWKKLAKDPRIVAMKDSSGEDKRLSDYQNGAHGNALVYTGREVLGLDVLSDGVVAGSSGVLPAAWSVAVSGNYESLSLKSTRHILKLKLKRFKHSYAANPIGAFKHMLKELGVISDSTMFDPNLEVSEEQERSLDALLADSDFQNIVSWGF